MPREPAPAQQGTPVLAGDGHAEASGILHLVGVQHVLAFARESSEVRVEQGVAEYYEQGFVVACVGGARLIVCPRPCGSLWSTVRVLPHSGLPAR